MELIPLSSGAWTQGIQRIAFPKFTTSTIDSQLTAVSQKFLANILDYEPSPVQLDDIITFEKARDRCLQSRTQPITVIDNAVRLWAHLLNRTLRCNGLTCAMLNEMHTLLSFLESMLIADKVRRTLP